MAECGPTRWSSALGGLDVDISKAKATGVYELCIRASADSEREFELSERGEVIYDALGLGKRRAFFLPLSKNLPLKVVFNKSGRIV